MAKQKRSEINAGKKSGRTDPKTRTGKPAPRGKISAGYEFDWKIVLSIFLIIVFSIVIYAYTLRGEFQFDDYSSIVDRYELHNISNIGTILKSAYRPLIRLSFALNYHFNGLNTFGYHLVNLAFHTLNGILVFWLALIIFTSSRLFGPGIKEENRRLSVPAEWLALIVSLIFVVHPVQVESVAYITSRSSLMTVFFSLLCILLFHYARRAEYKAVISKVQTAAPVVLYICSVISFIFSIASKEIGVVTPLIMLAFDYFFEPKPEEYKKNFGRWLLPYIPFFILIIFGLGYRGYVGMQAWQASKDGGGSLVTGMGHGIEEIFTDGTKRTVPIHVFTMLAVLGSYLRMLFFPINLNLDYQYPMYTLTTPIPESMLNAFPLQTTSFPYITGLDYRPFLGLFFLVLLIYLIKRWYPTYKLLSFSILFFFITMLPVMAPILADLIFEHHLYFGVMAFGLFAVFALDRLVVEAPFKIPTNTWETVAVILIAVMITGFTQGSIRRSLLWNSELAVWSDVIKKTPLKSRPHYNYGLAHARKLKNYDIAMTQFREAIRLDPKIAEYYHNLGTAAYYKGEDYEELYRKTKDPKYDQLAREMLQLSYDSCSKALELMPKHVEAQMGVANALVKWGRYNEAIERYKKLVEQVPLHYKAIGNMATSYLLKGDIENALKYYHESIEINPNGNEAYGNMIITYQRMGRPDLGIKYLEKIFPTIRDSYTQQYIKTKIIELQQEAVSGGGIQR
ncbi:MAG: hypothetical protein M1269_11085 [Chloroflexi bacterium]|nr:hypothetical protein [Chloroflexota bacterium]